jgi:hypothetical protein
LQGFLLQVEVSEVNGTAVYGIEVRPPAHQAACDAPTIFRFSRV